MTTQIKPTIQPARRPNKEWPSVAAVIATRGRPEMLRRAVRAIMAQDYSGELEIIVVFDQVEVDHLADIEIPDHRSIRTLENERTPGLAGGRNTGILAATADLIAFCDDDDEWLPGKLVAQVSDWLENPGAIGLATGITIHSSGGEHQRTAKGPVSFEDFLVSRVQEIHPSSLLWRRKDLLGRIGLVDEAIPASYGEDYDLLLRATKQGDLRSVSEPLVTVHWNRASFFDGRWRAIADGLTYILRKHPELTASTKGTARIAAQIAFAYAALGERSRALHWARSALRRDLTQFRAYAALAVALRIAPAGTLVNLVNRRGRGL